MKKNVVLYKKIQDQELIRLKENFNLTYFPTVDDDNRDAFLSALKEADGLIGASMPIPASLLELAPNLQAISTISVGIDRFDIGYLNAKKIPLMHTPNALTETTADTIFTLVLCAARRAIELSNMVRDGNWKNSIGSQYYGVDVHGKAMGIIGMGRIGYELGKRAHHGFNMQINYFNRRPNRAAENDLNATRLQLNELLKNSDFVCVVLPLNAETEKLIGKEEFNLMKPDGIFINGSRGKVVDEKALIEALESKQIRAAGLDVFEVEPLPETSPLCAMDNAIIFPHIGSATKDTRLAMVTCAVDNLINALELNITKNCFNASELTG